MSTERVPTPLIPVTGTTIDFAPEIEKALRPRTLDYINHLVHKAAGATSSLRVLMCVFPQEQTAFTYLELTTATGSAMLLTPDLILDPQGDKASDIAIIARFKTAHFCIERMLPCEHEIDPLIEKIRLATLFPSTSLTPVAEQLNRLWGGPRRHFPNPHPDHIKILVLYPHTQPDLDLVSHAQTRDLVFQTLPAPLR